MREGLRLLERREAEDAARLNFLRAATDEGWVDIAAGRFDDVADGGLEQFIATLGSIPPVVAGS